MEKSCGAIVFNDKDEVLVIEQTKGFFGFPKGHVEENETEIETAIRETKEETNIDIIIEDETRYEIEYVMPNKVRKQVIFFKAKSINDELKPQEGETLNCFFMDKEAAFDKLSYNNLKELYKRVIDKEV